ncbi:MAG: amidohydrolase [Candidatus Cloacimonetes bacterium HGW-Cloacimonetes-1]|jgi:N-acetyldiaminopimelate deacetylase|nr:MAG: amidohydrolase [Candidatus Cloacimonetes bacterium HGW-Cloacimonetes-1]
MKIDSISLRKNLHRIPELAFEEHKTKALLLSILLKMSGIRIHQFETNTGILVEYSHGEGSYKLFRADMDALPIAEKTGCSFSSLHPGIMHACGHDMHMAILMGLISQIVSEKPQKNLLFLFQPAEEGKGGAEAVLKEGIVQTFPIESVYALHVSGKLPVGTVSAKAGIFFAIPQEFDVQFIGKAAHAAFPADGRNALDAGVDFYAQMQAQTAELSHAERLIFHVGTMESGSIRNIVPDRCVLEGTHRTLTRDMSERLNTLLLNTAKAVAQSHSLDYKVDFLCSYDPVINDKALYEKLGTVCAEMNVKCLESGVFMTGEDFGFFTTRYPGLLFWLGASSNNQDLHSDVFLPDDKCIKLGIDIFERIALS